MNSKIKSILICNWDIVLIKIPQNRVCLDNTTSTILFKIVLNVSRLDMYCMLCGGHNNGRIGLIETNCILMRVYINSLRE